MTLTLSRADFLRPRAEDAIDRSFAEIAAVIIGPLGPLHALKRTQAMAGGGALVEDDADAAAILARAEAQDVALADLDRRRRNLKALVRAAGTAAEIRELLAAERIQVPGTRHRIGEST